MAIISIHLPLKPMECFTMIQSINADFGEFKNLYDVCQRKIYDLPRCVTCFFKRHLRQTQFFCIGVCIIFLSFVNSFFKNFLMGKTVQFKLFAIYHCRFLLTLKQRTLIYNNYQSIPLIYCYHVEIFVLFMELFWCKKMFVSDIQLN